MFKKNSDFDVPTDPTTPMWRYMDIAKFADLVTTRSLFFACVAQYADKFEGLLPEETKKASPHVAEWIRQARTQTFVSCWQLNTHESELMWRTYLNGKEGVVVQTNFERLTNSFTPCSEAIYGGMVRYIDYDIDTLVRWERDHNIFSPILHKRLEYTDEREFRVFLNTMSDLALDAKAKNKPGVKIAVDVDLLLEQVRLMPNSTPEFRQRVETLLANNNLQTPVFESALDKAPP